MKVMKTAAIWLVKNMEQMIIYKMTEKSDSNWPQLTTSEYECLVLNASGHTTNPTHWETKISRMNNI